jgi:hypothetical protein
VRRRQLIDDLQCVSVAHALSGGPPHWCEATAMTGTAMPNYSVRPSVL